jgi:hypothetical protein
LGVGHRLLVLRGSKLRQQSRINGAAIKLSQAEIAVEADAGDQSVAGCGIELLGQRLLSPRRRYSMIS